MFEGAVEAFNRSAEAEQEPSLSPSLSLAQSLLVNDFVDGRFLVAGSCHNVFVVCWDVAAQDGGRLLRLWEE